MNTINETNFQFPKQKNVYKGKVREVYNIDDKLLVMIASDRLSAFDVIMPRQIPFKGQILNQIATKMMQETEKRRVTKNTFPKQLLLVLLYLSASVITKKKRWQSNED